MARYTGPRGRRDRRAGVMLSNMRKNPLEKKPYPPGEHGRGRQRQTEFGIRLLEKQKARWYYGVSERQFRGAYDKATQMQGVSGVARGRPRQLHGSGVAHAGPRRDRHARRGAADNRVLQSIVAKPDGDPFTSRW